MDKLVSVILPCYNQGIYLEDALKSLIKQSYQNWEAIIVNDGSSDCTEKVAMKYISKDNRIHYVYQENKGVSSARNLGISKALGEFLLPLDPDDLLDSDFIQYGINVFKENPQYTLVYSMVSFFGEKQGVWDLHSYTDYKQFLLGNCIVCTSLFRKEDCLAIGGYDENMLQGLEDWEFYIRLLKGEKYVFRIPLPLFFYRIKTISRTTNCNKADVFQNVLVYIYKKHIDIYLKYYGDPVNLICQRDYYKRKFEKRQNKWYYKVFARMKQILNI